MRKIKLFVKAEDVLEEQSVSCTYSTCVQGLWCTLYTLSTYKLMALNCSLQYILVLEDGLLAGNHSNLLLH